MYTPASAAELFQNETLLNVGALVKASPPMAPPPQPDDATAQLLNTPLVT